MKLDKERINYAFNSAGDLTGLEEIERQLDQIENDASELLQCIMKLNYVLIETEQEEYASKYNIAIQEVYVEMKEDLFKMLDIEE